MKNKYYSKSCGNKRKQIRRENNDSFEQVAEKLCERWSEMIIDDIQNEPYDWERCEVKVKTIIKIIER